MTTTPDDHSWLGSGLGRDADGSLLIFCDEGSHPRLVVRDLRRSAGVGWWINPDLDSHRDEGPLHDVAAGTQVSYRVRLSIRCPVCDLNVELTGIPGSGEGALEILDHLADGGVSEIGLKRLCALVSNWR